MKKNTANLAFMKIAAAILGVIFLFFNIQSFFIATVQPVEKIASSKKMCCKHSQPASCKGNASSKDKETQNPCKGCNAYLSCPLCLYTFQEQSVIIYTPADMKAENKNEQNNFIISTFSAACWHPPESFPIV